MALNAFRLIHKKYPISRNFRTLSSLTVSYDPDKAPDTFQSAFLSSMQERGYIHQCTDFKALDNKLCNATVNAYLGFDATARSLHVGSLLQIMILRMLQKKGHKPIILVGGGTTSIGDPSGKDESRKLISSAEIRENIDSLTKVFSKFIKFGEGHTDAIIVNNAEWLENIKYLDYLRDYGRYFTINRMLNLDSVKQRLSREQPLTFLEFNYMLLQSYDFLQLNTRYDVCLQLGGSDQWGNIVGGVELGRKKKQLSLYGLTAPLVATSDGRKMGKTAAGAVWLNKDLLSEFDYWQFWRNTADGDVIRFLKLFTELPIEQINEYEKELHGAELNAIKILLADECTKMLHGEDSLHSIHNTVDSLFAAAASSSATTNDLESLAKVPLSETDFVDIQDDENNDSTDATNKNNNDTTTSLSRRGISVVDMLVKSGLAATKSEARRMIKASAVRINDVKIEQEYEMISQQQFFLPVLEQQQQKDTVVDTTYKSATEATIVEEQDTVTAAAAELATITGRLKLSSGKKKHVLITFAAAINRKSK